MSKYLGALLLGAVLLSIACAESIPTSTPQPTLTPTPSPTPLSPHEQSRQDLLAMFYENYATWKAKSPQNYSFSLEPFIEGIPRGINYIQVKDSVVSEATNYEIVVTLWRKLYGGFSYSTGLHRDYLTESGEWRGDFYDPFEDFDPNARLYWRLLTSTMDYHFFTTHELISNWQPGTILTIEYDSEWGFPAMVAIGPSGSPEEAHRTTITEFAIISPN